jgi:hypothetical protein
MRNSSVLDRSWGDIALVYNIFLKLFIYEKITEFVFRYEVIDFFDDHRFVNEASDIEVLALRSASSTLRSTAVHGSRAV